VRGSDHVPRYPHLYHSLILTLFSCVFLLSPLVSLAQVGGVLPGETPDQDKDRPTRVSAIVQDLVPPSIPILIAPTDSSQHTSGDVSFTWVESTDNWQMSHYRLIINGSVAYDTIPLNPATTAQYELTYDVSLGQYTLNPTANLADGTYSWRIEAVDVMDNSSSSVTWTFTIDTLAPFFTISQIGTHSVTITTLDSASIPVEPIILTANNPTLSGTGEAGSSVTLTLTEPDDSTTQLQFSIAADGTWSIELGTLPRSRLIRLDFLIVDQAGNVSVLENVRLLLPAAFIEIPVPPILLPIIPPVLLPEPPEPPVIQIPITPPQELIPEIEELIPPALIELSSGMAATYQEFSLSFVPILLAGLGVLSLLLLPVLKTVSFFSLYAGKLGFGAFWKVWWAVGLDGWWRDQSVVVTYPEQDIVARTLVRIRGVDSSKATVTKDLISDERGVIPAFGIGPGRYRITVLDERLEYPVLNKTPLHLDRQRFYIGQEIEVTAESKEPWLVIPAGTLKPLDPSSNWKRRVLRWKTLQWPVAIAASGLVGLWPSVIGIIAIGLYLSSWSLRSVRRRRSRRIETITKDQQAVVHCTIIARDGDEVRTITQTDETGIAHLSATKQTLTLETISWKYRQTEGDHLTQCQLEAGNEYHLALLTNIDARLKHTILTSN